MATADVDIVNTALAMLGVKAITSLTADSSRAAQLGNQIYTTVRDSVLRDGQWNFAQVRKTLARLSTTPAFGMLYEYTLPTLPYCLRINETDPPDTIYTVESNDDGTVRVIRTNEPSLAIRYTARITDVQLYDAQFVQALATALAAELAIPLTESSQIEKMKRAEYEALISRAMSSDGQEGSTQVADINALLEVRQLGFRDFDRSQNKFTN